MTSSGALRSKDGTEIGFLRLGEGPPLVFVHGSLSVAESWKACAELLSDRFTCYLMDRRGRASSGDAPNYSIEREYEDVGALLAEVGAGACLFGHSYGAIIALESALRSPVARLILYEPPLKVGYAIAGAEIAGYRDALAANDPKGALEIALIRLVGLPREQFESLSSSPIWDRMVALAPGFVREMEAVDRRDPSLARYEALDAPTLLLVGSETRHHRSYESAIDGLSRTLRNAVVAELEGQGHIAHLTAPELLALRIREFLTHD
jgi:pimeloyl-ACP methyl ester carboxylesterase